MAYAVVAPSALAFPINPFSLSSLLIAAQGGALVVVGIVVSGMLLSSPGLGYLISCYQAILGSADVFAGVPLVLTLAGAFNAALGLIERKASIWQTGMRGSRWRITKSAPVYCIPPPNGALKCLI